MSLCTRHIGHSLTRLGLLALIALTLFPPGPSAPAARAQGAPPAVPDAPHQIHLPLLLGGDGGIAPDLIFTPNVVDLAPGAEASIAVRVEPAADLTGASFELPGVQDGVTSRFEAAADGTSGTLTIEANEAADADQRVLMVQGTSGDGAHGWVGALKITTQSTASARTLFVDPNTGSDTNDGAQAKPLKTLTKALAVVKQGDTIKLAGGGYGPGFNGEVFPADGLRVPGGVTIVGALDSGFPASTLAGTGGGVGLNFQGDATVRNLSFGGVGFGVGLFAKQGTQTLSNIFVGVSASRSAVIDGATLNGGIVLRGTARATLLAGAVQTNTTGSTIFVNSGTGVSVFEQARFTMDGGTITGGDPNCRSANGIFLNVGSPQATLKNEAIIRNIAGTALEIHQSSKATLDHSAILSSFPDGCAPAARVYMQASASLSLLRGTVVSASGGNNSTGIEASGDKNMTLIVNHSFISSSSNKGTSGTALKLSGEGNVVISNGSDISSSDKIALDAAVDSGMRITITGSTLDGGAGVNGVALRGAFFKLRNSVVTGSRTGIVITGGDANLGTFLDPGNNDFSGNIATGVTFETFVTNSFVHAVGNTWKPNTQGSDANGHYTQSILLTGENPLAIGKNFNLVPFNPLPTIRIQL